MLNARRREFRNPVSISVGVERKYRTLFTNGIVLLQLAPYNVISTQVANVAWACRFLHRSHFGHRRRSDQRENPCCKIDIGQALCLSQLSSWHRCTFQFPYSSTAIELANARCATRLLAWVESPVTTKALT